MYKVLSKQIKRSTGNFLKLLQHTSKHEHTDHIKPYTYKPCTPKEKNTTQRKQYRNCYNGRAQRAEIKKRSTPRKMHPPLTKLL